MKINNVIKALEKEGWKVEIKNEAGINSFNEKWTRNTYFCKNDKNKCSWFEYPHDEGKIDSIKVQSIKENDDLMTDYFPGIWCDTLKSLIRNMKY